MKNNDNKSIHYASYIMEMKREQRGLKYDDTSQDEEIIKDLQRGEKLSKSKHLKVIDKDNEIK